MYESLEKIPEDHIASRAAINGVGVAVVINYELYEESKPKNLKLYDVRGRLIFSIEPPEYSDAYTSVHVSGEKLYATTYSGWSMEINPETGVATKFEFLK